MAENKKGFLLYADTSDNIAHLPNEIKGQLFQLILDYVNDLNPEVDDLLLKTAFNPIKNHLKRDLEKYETKRAQWSDAGKKSAAARKKKATNVNDRSTNVKPRSTDSTVNVNDTVNDNVSVTAIVNVNDIKKKEYSQAIHDIYIEILLEFPIQLQPRNKKTKNDWLDTIEKLERIDKIPLEQILKIVKATRQDDFWAKNFMSLPKLRKKNPDGLSYIVVFNEKINKNGPNGQETRTPEQITRDILTKKYGNNGQ